MDALQNEISRLKKEKGAIVLGHNYQRKEVQEVSDFLGDSYGLSVQASKTDAKVIVFCGVDFMAESAKILNPGKIVLHPRPGAKCPMAGMVDAEGLRALKAQHPGAPVVSYVNTSAEVKAETDICCTSANAVKIVKSLPDKKVIFVPDTNLGLYVQRFVKDKEIVLWPGYCPTHVSIKVADLERLKRLHPAAEVLVHPECTPGRHRLRRLRILDRGDHQACRLVLEDGVHHRDRVQHAPQAQEGGSRQGPVRHPGRDLPEHEGDHAGGRA